MAASRVGGNEMSDSEDIESIRKEKRRELVNQMAGEGQTASGATDGSADGTEAPAEPIHISGPDHFQEVTNTYDVVLVDYHAEWCGPCKMLEPIVADLARETDAAIAKIDIDRHQGLAQQAGVRGVPTLYLYADGEAVEQLVGMQDPGRLRGLIQQYT